MKFLADKGADIFKVPVDRGGRLDLEVLEQGLKEAPTALVSIMFAKNFYKSSRRWSKL